MTVSLCPLCQSPTLILVTVGCVRLECYSCQASYVASEHRLIAACLLSHLDVTGSPAPWVTTKGVAMNHPTQEQFEAALIKRGFSLDAAQALKDSERSEPPAERRDCDEPILGVPRD